MFSENSAPNSGSYNTQQRFVVLNFVFVSVFLILSLILGSNRALAQNQFQTQNVIEPQREALNLVRVHQLAPPFAAWAFANANVAAIHAYETSGGSWFAYRAAFYQSWALALRADFDAYKKFRNTVQYNQQEERDQFKLGAKIAHEQWNLVRLSLNQATLPEPGRTIFSERMGIWRPTPPKNLAALYPYWGTMDLWGAESKAEITLGLNAPDWRSSAAKQELLQVAVLGDKNSTARSADQTLIATFWAAGPGTVTPPGMWIEIALDSLEKNRTNELEAAKVMSLLTQALSDAGVACWDLKYRTRVWRPISAIRDLIPGHDEWSPLLESPPFPGYVSGHSSFSGAGAAILQTLLRPNGPVLVTSEAHPGVVRQFADMWSAAEEAGFSRIYGGIHFASDNHDGLELGQRAACAVLKRAGINDCVKRVPRHSL